MMIPRVLHLMWIGGKAPGWVMATVNEYRQTHPDWSISMWTRIPENLPGDLRTVMEEAPTLRYASDVLRYWILYRHGGVYVDVDTRPLRPLGVVLDMVGERSCFHATVPGDERQIPDNFLMGSTPGSLFLSQVLAFAARPDVRQRSQAYCGGVNLFPVSPADFSVVALPDSMAIVPGWMGDGEYQELRADRIPGELMAKDPSGPVLKHYPMRGSRGDQYELQ